MGLIDKGSFTVDEIKHSGPPDAISIRAHSADFTSAIRIKRETSWRDTTLGAVLRAIAARNRLTLQIAPALAARAVASITQGQESDTALLRRLGREHETVATIKHGRLLFLPKGATVTASGKPLATVAISRRQGERRHRRVARSQGREARDGDGRQGRGHEAHRQDLRQPRGGDPRR